MSGVNVDLNQFYSIVLAQLELRTSSPHQMSCRPNNNICKPHIGEKNSVESMYSPTSSHVSAPSKLPIVMSKLKFFLHHAVWSLYNGERVGLL